VVLDAPYQFDWCDGCDGGGLDMAILSFAEFDVNGNVNVSRFGSRVNGVGGFISISQAARKMLFVGTFTASGLRTSFEHDELHIRQEGKVKKAVKRVSQISFSGTYAVKRKQQVMYITERAVFQLTENGLVLTEIAPGIDLQKDVLA